MVGEKGDIVQNKKFDPLAAGVAFSFKKAINSHVLGNPSHMRCHMLYTVGLFKTKINKIIVGKI